VPERLPLGWLPSGLLSPLLRAYCRRPGVDMGTGVFSHLELRGTEESGGFPAIKRVECIGPLPAGQPLGIYGVTHRERTWLTFTYDPALLSAGDMDCLIELYQAQLARAQREAG
jgi:hypothetical protein